MVQGAYAGSRFFYNVSEAVGKQCANRVDDVELVRFGYFCKGRNPLLLGRIAREEQQAIDAMRTIGPYGPDLQAVIDANQNARKIRLGTGVDGKISVARTTSSNEQSSRYDGKNLWMILLLNTNMKDVFQDTYPRIDFEIECGPALTKFIEQTFSSKGM